MSVKNYVFHFFVCNLSYAAHATHDQLESRAHSIEEISPEL